MTSTPTQVYDCCRCLKPWIAAWVEVETRLDDHPAKADLMNRLARAIRYGEQPPTRELARLLRSIPSSQFDIE